MAASGVAPAFSIRARSKQTLRGPGGAAGRPQQQQQPTHPGDSPWRGTTRLELVPRWAVVRDSELPGAGLGLFAARDLPPQFELGQYVGAIDRGVVFSSVVFVVFDAVIVAKRHPQ